MTFDPFLMLTVPLPVEKTRKVEITVVWLDGSRTPSKLHLKVVVRTHSPPVDSRPPGFRCLRLHHSAVEAPSITSSGCRCHDIAHRGRSSAT